MQPAPPAAMPDHPGTVVSAVGMVWHGCRLACLWCDLRLMWSRHLRANLHPHVPVCMAWRENAGACCRMTARGLNMMSQRESSTMKNCDSRDPRVKQHRKGFFHVQEATTKKSGPPAGTGFRQAETCIPAGTPGSCLSRSCRAGSAGGHGGTVTRPCADTIQGNPIRHCPGLCVCGA